MSRDLNKEIMELERDLTHLTFFYPSLDEYADRIWEAFHRNDLEKVVSSVDLFTIMVPKRAWKNKSSNGLQRLLDFTTFNSDLEMDIATGKRKLTKLEDL